MNTHRVDDDIDDVVDLGHGVWVVFRGCQRVLGEVRAQFRPQILDRDINDVRRNGHDHTEAIQSGRECSGSEPLKLLRAFLQTGLGFDFVGEPLAITLGEKVNSLVAQGRFRRHTEAAPFELDGQIKRKEPITIVDVRLPSAYKAGHIPGAINLPQGKWHTLAGLTKDRTAVIYCYSQTCKLAAAAAVEFASAGIPVVEMEGGFEAWVKNALPVEST